MDTPYILNNSISCEDIGKYKLNKFYHQPESIFSVDTRSNQIFNFPILMFLLNIFHFSKNSFHFNRFSYLNRFYILHKLFFLSFLIEVNQPGI